MSHNADAIITVDHLHPYERLRVMRERKSIKQADFAKSLDITQSTVSHWESGITIPSEIIRAKIADILGADPYSCECCGR